MKHLRKRVRGAVRILSCNGAKITRYACALLCAIALSSCTSSEETQVDTWGLYCTKYNVDKVNQTTEQENFYLDCYVGSVEEEQDINLNR